MNDQGHRQREATLQVSDNLGDFNNALQIAHSILHLLQGKLAQQDMLGAQALATMLHHQLAALEGYGVKREDAHNLKSPDLSVMGR